MSVFYKKSISQKIKKSKVKEQQVKGGIENILNLIKIYNFFVLKRKKRPYIWETLNLSACAIRSTNTIFRNVLCPLSPVTCQLSRVTCHMPPVPYANSHSHRPSPCFNSPTMHIRLVHKGPKTNKKSKNQKKIIEMAKRQKCLEVSDRNCDY